MAMNCRAEHRTLYAAIDGEVDHHRARELLAELDRQLDLELPQFRGSELLRQLDLNALLTLIEGGALGKLVEVESSNGDLVEVVVE